MLALSVFAQQASIRQANALYAQKNYAAAIQQYEQVRQSQGESAELYYNLGNAYYKTGDIAQAILNYNRALLLAPNNDDAQFNLQVAQRKVVDNVDVTSVFFLKQWINNLGDLLTSDGWAIMSIVLFILSLSTFLLFVFGRFRSIRKTAFNIAAASLIITFRFVGLCNQTKQ